MRRESKILLLTTAAIVIATAWIAISMISLYRTALGQVRTNLVAMVQSQARLVEAAGLLDTLSGDEAKGGDAFAAQLGRVIDSHNRNDGFGETGEYRLAQIRGDSIVFLLDHAGHGGLKAEPIHIDGELAQPMRLALQGDSGTTIDLDYRGIKVLAAYVPIRVLHLGLVVKIDLAEIRRPYSTAGIILGTFIVFMISAGAVIFRRNGSSLIQQTEEGEDFRLIAETALDAIISMDQDSIITYVNPSVSKIFGYSPTEMLGQPLEMLLPRDLQEDHSIAFLPFIGTSEKPASWDKLRQLGQHKSGSQFPVEMSLGMRIQPDGSKVVIGFLRDITVRAELEEMWRRYETIINNSLIQQSFINRQYIYEAVNDAYCKAKRLERNDIIGKTVSEIWGAKTFEDTIESHLNKCFQGEEVHYEAKFPYNDEEERWFSVYYFPYSDGTGLVTNAIVMSEDITVRKHAEEALKSSEDQLRQLQKIEAVGQLAGGVAHDFNNLLQVIQGYTQMAFEETEPESAIHQHLLEAVQAIDKAGTLIRQL
ncbi:MAG: PAS domain S-box protein, partial [Candidatus Marinimicrobia bacterium]|nr:PAS domain S-box protein [Candidatus Neomarinimicrobiota bacterium]